MMYRVIAIIVAALALGACSSSPDWLKLDALKPAPIVDTVRMESEPPGAEAKVSNGQTCRTPCALALPVDAPLTVVFSLNGYQPESETIEPVSLSGNPTEMRPNPVLVQLTALPPQPKSSKKSARKPAAKKPATAKPKAARAKPAATAAPQMQPAPAEQQAPAPWPTAPQPQQ